MKWIVGLTAVGWGIPAAFSILVLSPGALPILLVTVGSTIGACMGFGIAIKNEKWGR